FSRNYKLTVTKRFEKTFKKLPPQVREYLKKRIFELEQNPGAGQPLKGKYTFLHSLHLGFKGIQYRVIYTKNDKARTIELIHAGPRENIYTVLDRLKLKAA